MILRNSKVVMTSENCNANNMSEPSASSSNMDQDPVPQVQPQGMETLMAMMQTMSERIITSVNEKFESQAKTAEENSRAITEKLNCLEENVNRKFVEVEGKLHQQICGEIKTKLQENRAQVNEDISKLNGRLEEAISSNEEQIVQICSSLETLKTRAIERDQDHDVPFRAGYRTN